MDMNHFKSDIAPKLKSFTLKYNSFLNGDFGDLERVEFFGEKLTGTLDLWSLGWMDINIFDLGSEELLMNNLYTPAESDKQKEAISLLIRVLLENE